jgi:hypothetical protein
MVFIRNKIANSVSQQVDSNRRTFLRVGDRAFLFQSDRKAFTTGAVRDGVRVGNFKAALLQVFAVVEH